MIKLGLSSIDDVDEGLGDDDLPPLVELDGVADEASLREEVEGACAAAFQICGGLHCVARIRRRGLGQFSTAVGGNK